MFSTMPQNLVIKILFRHNVQQETILSLDCSLPLLHQWEQKTGLTFQNSFHPKTESGFGILKVVEWKKARTLGILKGLYSGSMLR